MAEPVAPNFRAPSAAVLRGTRRVGTVGCVVRWRGKQYLTTAAHVARRFGDRLEVHGLGPVEVARVVWDRRADIALLDPLVDLPNTACLLPDGTRLTGSTTSVAVDAYAFMFRRGRHTFTRTNITKIPDRDHPFLRTPVVTSHGDSGAVLMDGRLRALGTLVGEFGGFDCFLPLAPLLSVLDLTLEK